MLDKLIKTLFLLLIPVSSWGQITSVTDQYILNPLVINPAFAGGRGTFNMAAYYRRQWAGITGSPETMTLSADAALLDRKLGLGFMISNDKYGVTKQTRFNFEYSYKIKMKSGILSFGLSTGLITTNTKYSDLKVIDTGDEKYLADSRVFVVPDFSFGTFYTYKSFFAGISIPALLGYEFDFNKDKYSITVNPGHYGYLLNTGYTFNLSKKLSITPSTLLNYSPGKTPVLDVNVNMCFADRFWIGASYRSTKTMVALMQVSLNKQLKLAYTFDFDFNQLGRFNNGSHEIMIRYEFRYKVNVVNPLIF